MISNKLNYQVNYKMNITRNQMLIGALLLFLFFAPAKCNGVTYWRGFRGCSTGNEEEYKKKESGSNSMFFDLIRW
tara:strand:- start:152 stop:376 length:225 start_codon:yes stop_codon:yes gene_type:complete